MVWSYRISFFFLIRILLLQNSKCFLVPPARPYIDMYYSRSMSLRYKSFLDAGVLQRLAETHSPGIEVFQTYIQISSCFGDRLTVYEAMKTLMPAEIIEHAITTGLSQCLLSCSVFFLLLSSTPVFIELFDLCAVIFSAIYRMGVKV